MYNIVMQINNSNIINDTDPRIRMKSKDVNIPLSTEDEELLMAMLEYVKDSTDEQKAKERDLTPAVGLAAIQLGVDKKMLAIAIRDEEGDFECEYALANPKIISYSIETAYLKGGEGCLSVKTAHEGYVKRHERIKVKGYDAIKKKEVTIRASDYLAIVFQHELDHFKGILYYDHINSADPFKEEKGEIVIE